MAMSDAEKKAKAHEYYVNYRKKGKKKGRKKGTSKTSTKKTNLVGLSTGGLNDAGKMEWAMAKEKLKSEMNDAMSKASTPEEKEQIRKEYQNKALQELTKMKNDPSMAKAKSTKSSASKSGSSKSSSGSKSSKGSSTKSSGSKSTKSESADTTSKATEALNQAVQQMKDYVDQLTKKLLGDGAEDILSKLTEEQKEVVRKSITDTIEAIKKKMNKE